jgi:LacI family transcriptional regulator, repressor for deo operon, udp, cdd, tsx, nupC, and nupG
VFAANALTAIAALGEAIDLGRGVPQDVAIVGYDDIAALSDLRPRITTVACSPHTIGRAPQNACWCGCMQPHHCHPTSSSCHIA